MSEEFKLPSLGEGVKAADIAEIKVSAGDRIAPGQVLMELETEKAVMELPCEVSGTIEKLLVTAGQTVQVGQALFTYAAEAGETAQPAATQPAATPAPEVAAPAGPADPVVAAAPAAPAAPVSKGKVTFVLPNLGEGVKSADVAEIVVKVGDVVTVDQTVMELETDKAVMELPCPHAGTVLKIFVKEGDTLSIGSPVLEIEAVGQAGTAPSSAPAPVSKRAEAVVPQASEPRPTVPRTTGKPEAIVVAAPTEAENGMSTPIPAAPSTRRLARELGVELRRVRGTGGGGRITAEDVQGYVRNQLQALSTAPPARPAGGSMSVLGGGISPPPLPDFTRFGVVEREAMNKIARVTAENLTVSWNVIPHVTQHDLADITDLEEARKRFGNGLGKNGPKVTMTAIVMKALATCLKAFPKFNSSLDPETNEIVYKKYYSIGCAVDTPNGLVVPVVKDCDQKSILQIAADITELANKARDRKLTMDSMQGATCTVTNLGGIGGIGFTPIVNYPEVCILGMSRGQQDLKLINGQVVERLMLPLSLSYDHRVINGADAARFLVTLCNLLADPFQLLTTV